ncbi:MAG: AI-2E family transporter [Ginsengibacter sp.]
MDRFNNRLRQILILAVIILIAVLIIRYFYIFIPGVLGSITLYILSKKSYFSLVEKKKWRRQWTALLYIFAYLIIICLPVYFAVVILVPKVVDLFNNPVQLMVAAKTFAAKIQSATGIELINGDNLQTVTKNLASRVPMLLTGTANFITNLLLMFFVLYYMLIHGRTMDKYLEEMMPLKNKNREILSVETDIMIRANAIGIPLLAVIQGLVAALGYFIFGIKDVAVWGFLTGVASLIPIVGTGVIWVPLTIYLFASGHTWQGFGLGIYSLAILTNIDYVARITLLRKIGNVHPLITIFGIIVGVGMFGFLGLVFGPLLISYFIVLVKIYRNEFNSVPISPLHEEEHPVGIKKSGPEAKKQ